MGRSTKRIFGGDAAATGAEAGAIRSDGVARITDRGLGATRSSAQSGGSASPSATGDGAPDARDEDDVPTVAIAAAGGGPAPPDAREPEHFPLRCPQCATLFSEAIKFCPFDGQMLEPAPDWDPTRDPLLGQTVSGRYEVEGTLAEGSMGTAYRVRHTNLETRFAMKVLRRELAEDPRVAARLVEEARATAAIGHPNIVSVSDFGQIDNSLLPELGSVKLPYFVMEYLEGGSLADAIRVEGPLEAQRVVRIMSQVTAALAAAHDMGIVHRDLKPESIRLTHTEAGEIAKIVDFGVAVVMGNSKRTKQGFVYGTPHYMSPEQAQGSVVDGRTDIYALGVIMYQCLTGELPFVADSHMGVVTKHIFADAPTPPPAVLGGLPLGPMLNRCLEKEPDKRYPTMAELHRKLEALLAGRDEPSLRTAAPKRLVLREPEPVVEDGRLELAAGLPTAHGWLWGVLVAASALVLALTTVLLLRHCSTAPGAVPSAERAARPSAIASQPPAAPSTAPVATAPLASGPATAGPSAAVGAASAAAATASARGTAGAGRPRGSPPHAQPPRHHPRPSSGPPGEVVDPWAN